jgi:hypothetical protein
LECLSINVKEIIYSSHTFVVAGYLVLSYS